MRFQHCYCANCDFAQLAAFPALNNEVSNLLRAWYMQRYRDVV